MSFGKNDPVVQQEKAVAQQQQALAGPQQAFGEQLQNYFLQGQLPPGQEAQIQLALSNALAGTRGKFAQFGLGDSTMEQSGEAYDQLQAQALRAEILKSIATLGQEAIGAAGQDLSGMGGTLNDIIAHETAQNTAMTGAIGQFAGALGKAGAPGAGTAVAGTGDAIGSMLASLGVDLIGA